MKRCAFIVGKNLALTILQEEDVLNSNWHQWFNDEETCYFLQKHYFPNTIEQQLTFLNSLQDSRTDLLLGLCHKNNLQNQIFGVVGLHEIDNLNQVCSASLVIGDKEHRTTNNAIEALYLAMDHGFNYLNLRKIKVGQFEDLAHFGRELEASLGFKKEGFLESEVYKHGRFINIQLMACFRDDFCQLILNDKPSFATKARMRELKKRQ